MEEYADPSIVRVLIANKLDLQAQRVRAIISPQKRTVDADGFQSFNLRVQLCNKMHLNKCTRIARLCSRQNTTVVNASKLTAALNNLMES